MPRARGIFAGTVGTYNSRLQLTHPGYTMLDDFDAGERKALIPIYRQVGKLHTWTVTESVRRVLDVLDHVPDALPAQVRARRELVSRTEALRGIHTPDPPGFVTRTISLATSYGFEANMAPNTETVKSKVWSSIPSRLHASPS